MTKVLYCRALMAAIFAGACAVPVLAGPPLVDKIPADAVVYVGWKGTGQSAEYAGSNFKGMIDALDVSAQWRAMSDARLARMGKSLTDDERAERDRVQAILMAAFEHPWGFYFGGVDFSVPGKPVPHIALLIDAGADGAKLVETIKQEFTYIESKPEIKDNVAMPAHGVMQKGSLVVITVGTTPSLDLLLADGAPNAAPLSSSADFKAALAQGDVDPFAIAYVDASAAVRTIDAAVAAKNAPDSMPAQNWPKARDLLNLGALSQMMYMGRFEGKGFVERCFVAMPADKAKRFGVLSLLDFPAMSDASLNAIPASATWGGAFHFDGKRILAEARDAANKLGDTQGRQFDGALQLGASFVGLDMEKELFPNLSNEWTYFATPAATGQTLPGLTLVNHVTNHDKAHAAFDNLETFINDSIADRSPDPMKAPQFAVTTVDGLAVHTINVPRTSPSWALDAKDYFYLGLSPQAVEVASDHIAKGTPSIFTVAGFASAFKSIDMAHVNSLNFSDLSQTGPIVYHNALRRLAAEAKARPEEPAVTLPPVEKIMPYLGWFVSASTLDASGFHTTTVGPFPGATLLSGPQALMSSVQPEGVRPRRKRAERPAAS